MFTGNETITNLAQYELSQEENDSLKAGLYFPIQPDKIGRSEIFTIFKKIDRCFIKNLKSGETKSQIKMHLSYLANSYFYNHTPSVRILDQYCVLKTIRKNNRVAFLDRKHYDNTIPKIISDTSKFETLDEGPTLKSEVKYNGFYVSWKKKHFNENEYNKLFPAGPAPVRIYGTPKMHRFSSCDLFSKFHRIVSSIDIFYYNLAGFLCDRLSTLVPNDYSCEYTFPFFW